MTASERGRVRDLVEEVARRPRPRRRGRGRDGRRGDRRARRGRRPRRLHRPPRLHHRRRPAPRLQGRRRRPGLRPAREHRRRRLPRDAAARCSSARPTRPPSAPRSTGQPVALDAMSAIERKVVHEHLKERGGVETFSEGQEPDRHLVVAPLELSCAAALRPTPAGAAADAAPTPCATHIARRAGRRCRPGRRRRRRSPTSARAPGVPGLVLADALPGRARVPASRRRGKQGRLDRGDRARAAGSTTSRRSWSRAEEWDGRRATSSSARALAALPVLCEYAAPLLARRRPCGVLEGRGVAGRGGRRAPRGGGARAVGAGGDAGAPGTERRTLWVFHKVGPDRPAGYRA